MTQPARKPVALSIAGFDPSGGAGVLADLKTFVAHDCYGAAVITAITAQNTREVRKVAAVDAPLVRMEIETLFEDVTVAGIKIGMVCSRKTLEVIAEGLAARKNLPMVIDPVFRSWVGPEFLSPPDVEAFRRLLLPLAQVLTPNAQEAGRLLGTEIATLDDMKGAAKLLHEQGVPHVVITGGHLEKPADVYYEGQDIEVFGGHRTESQADDGIGCTFSAAILANMLHGKSAKESVVLAKAYVSQAVARAYAIGAGRGPLNHLFRFGDAQTRVPAVEAIPEEPHR